MDPFLGYCCWFFSLLFFFILKEKRSFVVWILDLYYFYDDSFRAIKIIRQASAFSSKKDEKFESFFGWRMRKGPVIVNYQGSSGY